MQIYHFAPWVLSPAFFYITSMHWTPLRFPECLLPASSPSLPIRHVPNISRISAHRPRGAHIRHCVQGEVRRTQRLCARGHSSVLPPSRWDFWHAGQKTSLKTSCLTSGTPSQPRPHTLKNNMLSDRIQNPAIGCCAEQKQQCLQRRN